ncbi:serine hydrolase [Iodidimonas muriae]|uniref:Serine hydrolase n=1 Tax=Iodidimonas muriae TaxID=261467 RepID=A0ABQ2L6J0_9PROT|nr:serine hydrolase domain-containing protein [Iodidimonas muriae]GGO04742.1 serine hydrolase [Iodidimonas muriae]
MIRPILLCLLCLLPLSGQAQNTPPGQELSPGAFPPPPVTQDGLPLLEARPNFANINALGAFIDGVVESRISRDHLAGVTVAVVKDGRIITLKGYGTAGNGQKVQADKTLFRLGGISQSFTWTGLMQLVESGHIPLDAPINRLLPPELAMPVAPTGPLLVRHLLARTSGLESTSFGHTIRTTAQSITDLGTYLQRYRPKSVRPAGQFTVPSPYAAALAGTILSHVTGRNVASYMEEQIFAPLGMTHTSLREPFPQSARESHVLPPAMNDILASMLSQGFAVQNGRPVPQDFDYRSHYGPAASASATALDMARFMLAHLNDGAYEDGRILQADTAKMMRTHLFSNAQGMPGTTHGFREYNLPGGLQGIGEEGHTLFFRAKMVMVPDLDLGLFIATNTSSGTDLVSAFADLLVARYFAPDRATANQDASTGAATTSRPRPITKADARNLTGYYLSLDRPFTLVEALFRAPAASYRLSLDDQGYISLRNGTKTRTYGQIAPLRFQSVNGEDRLVFLADSQSDITYLIRSDALSPLQHKGKIAPVTGFYGLSLMLAVASIMALFLGWHWRKRSISQTPYEAVAEKLIPLMGLLWLFFLAFFATNLCSVALNPQTALADFPPASLIIALWLALGAASVTLLSLACFYPLWRYHSWPLWQRLCHMAITLIALCYVVSLSQWNALGFHYF